MSQETYTTLTASSITGNSTGNSEMITANSGSGSTSSTEAQQMLDSFWQKVVDDIKNLTVNDFKNQELPLARIKKIMKLDDDVKVMMISAEAPVLFAKAAEIFITETSLRAWIHTEDNKRRTLQRNDIAMAITKNDQFDFLIDIVPRDEVKPTKRPQQATTVSVGGMTIDSNSTTLTPEQLQNYYTLVQQQTALPQGATTTGQPQQIQILQTTPASIQTTGQYTLTNTPQLVHVQVPNAQATSGNELNTNNGQHSPVTQGQVFHISGQPGHTATATSTQQSNSPPGQIQILQQVITSNGEIVQQPIPIQLTPAQLQLIRLQSQAPTNQPIIIQAAQLNQAGGAPQYQIAGQPFLQTVVTSSASGGNVDGESHLEENEQHS